MKPLNILLFFAMISIAYQAQAQYARALQKDKSNECIVDNFATPFDNGSTNNHYPLPATGNDDFSSDNRQKETLPFINFSEVYQHIAQ